ncbi:MAG: branched-chain amino acid ABC transporter permease [Armatimonadota bacterium]|nr:branched-chain amino acid ABC transporter permease [Armatimonadota bacterium]MDR7427965.1 branched-chain amino acid ABC transporter permease [Armatimonadota bacterium]MDR7464148.1 branched-chain amino acid ABC transporter permease [Armatimonadota bacterium]MDR7470439.1 branched-chain amino acid ABC transporter permease [Armatimonadota bacterium]MDR7473521.1 branched-chain amino acid ABC transporter permease [Armatimonadota bacterium]
MLGQQVINGLTMGAIYAVISLGLTLVYGALRILHVAHAGIYVLGGYAGLVAYAHTGSLLLAFLLAMTVSGLAGVIVQRWIYLPLLPQPRIIPLIASIGLFIALEDLLRIAAGPYSLAFSVRVPVPSVALGAVALTSAQLLVVTVGVPLLALTWWVLTRTKVGLAWRALAEDLEMAQMSGVDVNRAVGLNFLVGSALAGAAGVLVGIFFNAVEPTMGDMPAYKGLAIIVLGGLGSYTGAVVASLLLGVVEAVAIGTIGLLPRDALAFIALILILLVRPQGLFGKR